MSEENCPFCGEPRIRQCHTYNIFRCGTQGPDINGEYDTGRACDLHTHHRLLAKRDAEIERLRATVDRLPKTADGVPVTPGMECWYRSCGGRVVSFQISDWGDIATDWDDSGPRYYSTRAAAREAAGGDG